MNTPRERLKAFLVIPEVKQFIDALDDVFPERTPQPSMDYREIDREIGKREVVRFLRVLESEAAENILENK